MSQNSSSSPNSSSGSSLLPILNNNNSICGIKTFYSATDSVATYKTNMIYTPCALGIVNGAITLFLFGIGGICNAMVLLFFMKRAAIRRKVANLLFMHQALVDLLHCLLFMLPWGCFKMFVSLQGSSTVIAEQTVTVSIDGNFSTTQPTNGMALFVGFEMLLIFPLSGGLSGITQVVTAMERYLAICWPFRHRQHVTRTRCVKILILAWLITLIYAAALAYTITKQSFVLIKVGFIACLVAQAFFCVIYIVTYYRARQSVRNKMVTGPKKKTNMDANSIKHAKKELRLTIIFMVMFLVWIILGVPLHIYGGFLDDPDIHYEHEDFIYFFPTAFSAAVNPILTLLLRDDFKPTWLKLISRK